MAQLSQLSNQLAAINKRQDSLQAELASQASVAHPSGIAPYPASIGAILPPSLVTDNKNATSSHVRFQVPLPTISLPTHSVTVNPATTSSILDPQYTPGLQYNSALGSSNPDNFNYSQGGGYIPSVGYQTNPSCMYERRPLSRSGISYSGSSSGITIDMFLFQLDSVVSTMKINPETLLCELHTILKDVALQWYWAYRKHNPMASWFDLRRDFTERFKDRRTNYEIRRMVESRKQQPNESFVDYYHHMWSLTLQYRTPYSDEEFMQILINNMKPVLQYYLTDRQFYSINDLIKSCSAWKDTLKRFRMQPDPSSFHRRNVNELLSDWPDESVLNSSLDAAFPEANPNPSVAAY